MAVTDFGITALASSLGEPCDVPSSVPRYGVSADIVAAMGFRTFHRAPAGISTTDFAVAAARAALGRAEVATDEVDLLVAVSGGLPEYLLWDFSAAVARDLGMPEVRTVSLGQGCMSAVMSFENIAGLLATREEVRTVLLVSAERVCDTHLNRLGNGSTAESDGAVAAVLRRGHPSLRWLASEQVTDARYADFFRLEYGGAAAPVAPKGRGNREIDPAVAVFQHFGGDAERFTAYAESTHTRLLEAVDGACARAGVPRSELSRVILLHSDQITLARQAVVLGIDPERTNADLAALFGHFGGLDPLLCLDWYLDAGQLAEGDVVALAGMSAGLHWFCTLLRV
ncbi:3-oxoacyl-[acyl-carrier-protein] synthase III C-terminal domain-containing protein [Streptomyces sp. TP-A0874]|uniref:3-oxoacyl-[acyl-carrier-protein] synthase III C-terminal domain-containing protein n=1 Tax=Streptomyces sp. TP-A0874 TaxID=549819 RepID=UPI001112DDCC|nr:3-oxoacyl-[acyl-carrier-protein] synthase III C-terminal domain-containing protein [Streptomyces sp. TP-A0874]